MLIAATMAKLFFAMALGVFIRRIGILGSEGTKNLSAFVVNITTPLLILSSVASVSITDKSIAVYALIIGFAIYGATIAGSLFAAKIFRFSDKYSALYQCSFIFPNSLFMGLPVAQSFLGSEAVFFIMLLAMPYNILLFSYGVFILTGEQKGVAALKKFINPGLVAAVISLFMFFTGLRFPTMLNDTLSFVGDVTTPLSMIVLGSLIGDYSLLSVLKDKSVYLVSAVRLILIPVCVWLVLRQIIDSAFLVSCAVIVNAMPVGSVMAMVASANKVMEKKASVIVALSTLLSMGTIPLIAFVTGIV